MYSPYTPPAREPSEAPLPTATSVALPRIMTSFIESSFNQRVEYLAWLAGSSSMEKKSPLAAVSIGGVHAERSDSGSPPAQGLDSEWFKQQH